MSNTELDELKPTVLPDLYSGWLSELLDGPLPAEPHATCAECAMLADEAEGVRPGDDFFHPATKCCTFFPELPSFLVGLILTSDDSSLGWGQEVLMEQISSHDGVSPRGLHRPKDFDLLYRHNRNTLGQNSEMVCPFYKVGDGSCGIWTFRDATCSTWFCKHGRGKEGAEFWGTVRELLSDVERALMLYCALTLDLSGEALRRTVKRFSSLSLGGPAIRESSSGETIEVGDLEGWGIWAGRELMFFEHCSRLVSELSWDQVVELSGARVVARAQLVREAHDRLENQVVPPMLTANDISIRCQRDDRIWITTYSRTDPLILPRDLLAVLPYFDGRSTIKIAAELKEELGIELDRELLRLLVDFDVLSAAGFRTSGGA